MRYLIIIIFLLFIYGLSVNHKTQFFNKIDENENRKLAEKPLFDINRLDYYPKKFEAYYNDNFAGRAYFVELYLWINKHIINKRSLAKNRYILGEDGFIFSVKKDLPLYIGERTLSNDDLHNIATEFNMRNAYFIEKGIKVYIQIIPSKFKVYSSKLPMLITKSEKHMGDRFVDYMTKHTEIPIVDATQIMTEKSKKENVYLKYDTHWNRLGAFYANQILIDTIRTDFPELQKLVKDSFNFVEYGKTDGNIKWVAPNKDDTDFGYKVTPKNQTFYKAEGYMHELEDFRYGQKSYCKRYKTNKENGLKVLFIRDSFANFTLSFLPEMFGEILYIWDDWKYKFNKEIVDIEQPDIIVYSLYEGYIDRLLMEPSFVESKLVESEVQ